MFIDLKVYVEILNILAISIAMTVPGIIFIAFQSYYERDKLDYENPKLKDYKNWWERIKAFVRYYSLQIGKFIKNVKWRRFWARIPFIIGYVSMICGIVLSAVLVLGVCAHLCDSNSKIKHNAEKVVYYESLEHPTAKQIEDADTYNAALSSIDGLQKEGIVIQYVNTEKMWAKMVINIEKEVDIIKEVVQIGGINE